MKLRRSIVVAGVFALAACGGLLLLLADGGAPQDDAEDVEPLEATAMPTPRILEIGLSTSLAPAEMFGDFGKMEGDRSFHADVAFYEVVLSYGPISDPRPILLLDLPRFRGRVSDEVFKRIHRHQSAGVWDLLSGSSPVSVAKKLSHIALSYASPTEPIDGLTPACLQRRPNAIDVYCVP